jgi:hypothetical protein
LTVKGTCRLCLTPSELQDSHLLPKALYKLLKNTAASDGQKNPNPVVVNKKIALKTSAQISDYLLCKQCERRFSTGGEKWMMEHCWRSDSDFPLRSTLENATPVHVGHSGLSIYEGASISGVDIAKTVYFAASVFWRASAHEWGPILGQKPVKLVFGPYEESLRIFLVVDGDFPKDVVLLVTVSSTKEAGANEYVLFPFLRNKTSGFKQYMFCIPGVTFQLFVGKAIPGRLRVGCTARSKNNLLYLGSNDFTVGDMGRLISKAQPKGDLA